MTVKNTKEIRSLTGARGIASLCVAIAHSGFDHSPWVYFWSFPDAAVDLFFCLSGFSLCLAYKAGFIRKLDFWPYMRARFARIYPLYALSLVLMWWFVFRHLAGSSLYPAPLAIGDAIRQILMVNSWPLIGNGSSWDIPAWSLSVEALCYIALFPLLFRALAHYAAWTVSQRLCLLVVLAFASVLTFTRLWDAHLVSVHLYTGIPVAYWIPVIRGFTMFTAGAVTYSFWVEKGPVAQLTGEACDAIALAGVGILAGACIITVHKDYLALLAPAFILGLASNDRAYVSRACATPVAHWLGEISYSLYLLHVPVDFELHHIWPALAQWPWPDFIVTMSAMLAISSLSYYLFESPLRTWIKGQKSVTQAAPRPM